jgi:hypothetical protein
MFPATGGTTVYETHQSRVGGRHSRTGNVGTGVGAADGSRVGTGVGPSAGSDVVVVVVVVDVVSSSRGPRHPSGVSWRRLHPESSVGAGVGSVGDGVGDVGAGVGAGVGNAG